MKKLLSDPKVRLVARALVAGLAAFLSQYVTNDAPIRGAIVGAVLVGAEVLTPLNQTFGLFAAALAPVVAPTTSAKKDAAKKV